MTTVHRLLDNFKKNAQTFGPGVNVNKTTAISTKIVRKLVNNTPIGVTSQRK